MAAPTVTLFPAVSVTFSTSVVDVFESVIDALMIMSLSALKVSELVPLPL